MYCLRLKERLNSSKRCKNGWAILTNIGKYHGGWKPLLRGKAVSIYTAINRYRIVSNTNISIMSAMHILSSGDTVTLMFSHVSPLPMPSNMIRLWNIYPNAVFGNIVDARISLLVMDEYLGWKIMKGA